MDTSFIGKPHEWDPRRLYSQTGADWQHRVDFDRLRKDRLQRLREQMKVHKLGALVLFAGANIRYATASYQGNWKYNINIRYAVLPQGGEPVLFETAGSDLQCAKIDLPWMEGRIRPGDHLAVGRRRGSVHGRAHGRERDGRFEGAQAREGTHRHRQSRHARAGGLSEVGPARSSMAGRRFRRRAS